MDDPSCHGMERSHVDGSAHPPEAGRAVRRPGYQRAAASTRAVTSDSVRTVTVTSSAPRACHAASVPCGSRSTPGPAAAARCVHHPGRRPRAATRARDPRSPTPPDTPARAPRTRDSPPPSHHPATPRCGSRPATAPHEDRRLRLGTRESVRLHEPVVRTRERHGTSGPQRPDDSDGLAQVVGAHGRRRQRDAIRLVLARIAAVAIPSRNRPPETAWRVEAMRATSAGSRFITLSTNVPRNADRVRDAAAASIVHASSTGAVDRRAPSRGPTPRSPDSPLRRAAPRRPATTGRPPRPSRA